MRIAEPIHVAYPGDKSNWVSWRQYLVCTSFDRLRWAVLVCGVFTWLLSLQACGPLCLNKWMVEHFVRGVLFGWVALVCATLLLMDRFIRFVSAVATSALGRCRMNTDEESLEGAKTDQFTSNSSTIMSRIVSHCFALLLSIPTALCTTASPSTRRKLHRAQPPANKSARVLRHATHLFLAAYMVAATLFAMRLARVFTSCPGAGVDFGPSGHPSGRIAPEQVVVLTAGDSGYDPDIKESVLDVMQRYSDRHGYTLVEGFSYMGKGDDWRAWPSSLLEPDFDSKNPARILAHEGYFTKVILLHQAVNGMFDKLVQERCRQRLRIRTMAALRANVHHGSLRGWWLANSTGTHVPTEQAAAAIDSSNIQPDQKALEACNIMRAEWIVWFDFDTIIMNPSISLESLLLDPAGEPIDDALVVAGRDADTEIPFNSGVVAVRRDDETNKLLEQVWAVETTEPDNDQPSWFAEMARRHDKGFRVLESCALNQWQAGWQNGKRWMHGDFVTHVYGMNKPRIMRPMLAAAKQAADGRTGVLSWEGYFA